MQTVNIMGRAFRSSRRDRGVFVVSLIHMRACCQFFRFTGLSCRRWRRKSRFLLLFCCCRHRRRFPVESYQSACTTPPACTPPPTPRCLPPGACSCLLSVFVRRTAPSPPAYTLNVENIFFPVDIFLSSLVIALRWPSKTRSTCILFFVRMTGGGAQTSSAPLMVSPSVTAFPYPPPLPPPVPSRRCDVEKPFAGCIFFCRRRWRFCCCGRCTCSRRANGSGETHPASHEDWS